MSTIVDQAAEYVSDFFSKNLDENFHFHNLKHTEQTVAAAQEICKNSDVSKTDTEMVLLAAWFHDTGYTEVYKGHEEKSARIAETFLKEHNYPGENIETIKEIILKTKIESEPETQLEKIMRDADLAHLAKKSGPKKAQKLRRELKDVCDQTYSDKEWLEIDQNFYSKAEYYTDYAQKNWQSRISENVQKISKKLDNMDSENSEKKDSILSDKELKKLQKIKTSERGVETVFRTTSRNHLRLSSMADTKANTLISISALVISIIISFLVDSLDVQPFLTVPTSILLVVCVVTIIFATLSTRPKVTKLSLTKEDIKQRRGNLLFFGNFYQMPLEDYEWGMTELMNDREYLYSNLTKDIYFLGLVLAKKYKFLSIAYNVFMYGIIISVLSFLLVINF